MTKNEKVACGKLSMKEQAGELNSVFKARRITEYSR